MNNSADRQSLPPGDRDVWWRTPLLESDSGGSPDTWTAQDWRDFQWFGVCQCGRLRREHAVFDDAGMVTDLTARCDAGHETDLADIA